MNTGVYQIRNTVNGKIYIGSTAIEFAGRWREHRKNLRGGRHCNQHLQNAWRKHGEETFVFEILLYCDPENCILYEQTYLDVGQPEYNICMTAGSSLGYRHTEETKARLSQIAKERLKDPSANPMYGRRGESAPAYGRKHSRDARQKMSEAHMGVKNPMYGRCGANHPSHGKSPTEQTRRQIALSVADKLTIKDVRVIKRALRWKIPQSTIAKHFQVSQALISKINTGKRWGLV